MLVIYTVRFAKSIDIHRGKKTSTLKDKDPLSFEIWIFRNGQPDRDDCRLQPMGNIALFE